MRHLFVEDDAGDAGISRDRMTSDDLRTTLELYEEGYLEIQDILADGALRASEKVEAISSLVLDDDDFDDEGEEE